MPVVVTSRPAGRYSPETRTEAPDRASPNGLLATPETAPVSPARSGADGSNPYVVRHADEEDGARAELFVSDGEAGTGDGGELAFLLAARGTGQEEEDQ